MRRSAYARQSRFGVTIIEIVVVMAILAVTLGIGVSFIRPPGAQAYATSLRNLVLQARFEAIRRNEPVVVAWDAGVQEFVARVAGTSQWCQDLGVELNRSNAADIGRLAVTTTVVGNGALVWIPSGQARGCARQPFDEDFADVTDNRTTLRVVIGSAGRVIIQ